MRLITYTSAPASLPRIAVRVGHRVLDIENASRVDGEPLPNTMKALLREGRGPLSRVRALAKAAATNAGRFSGAMFEEKAIRFLPPVPDPDTFLCVGKNYRAYTQQSKTSGSGKGMPEDVAGVAKLAASLVGHNAKVVKPEGVDYLDYEPEMVFVIGRRALGVTTDDDALDYIAGVTVSNGLGSVGPEIVTLDEIADPYDLWLTCAVNGEERMRVNTSEQVWRINDVIAHFSRSTPIEPGDMISTGAPGGLSLGKPTAQALSLKPGDVVECSIEGITTLKTTIVAPQ